MKKILGLVVFCFAFVFVNAGTASATISYHISLKNPEQHLFRVRMTIPEATPGTNVAIPAWNALYQVRDFSYRVRDVKATTAGGDGGAAAPISLQKLDKQTWQVGTIEKPGSAIDVTYSIEWDDPGPFNSQLNEHHAFVNFAEVLMYVPDRRAEAVDVKFDDVPNSWGLASELTPGADPYTFVAASYDALVDAPAEIGKFNQIFWRQDGVKYRVVVDGKDVRNDRLGDYLKKITALETKMMGGAPFAEYTFFVHVGSYPEVRRWRDGTCELHGDFGQFGGWSRSDGGARILSRVECEADSFADAGAGGFHQGTVHTGAVVCGRRDEHVQLVRAGTHGIVDEGTILRRPCGADQRAGVATGTHVAERGRIESGCVAGKVRRLPDC